MNQHAEKTYSMIRILVLLIAFLTLNIPVLAQDTLDQATEESPVLSIVIGEAEFINLAQVYLAKGKKKERTFQSDYYRTVGTLGLEEGSWSIIAAGIGGDDETTYSGKDFPNTDIELQASPQRCFTSLISEAAKAFNIKCPLRSLKFEVRSNSSQTLLLITQLSPRNKFTVTLTATKTPTPRLTVRPTITPINTLTATPSITPTDSPTNIPTPSRTPRPTVDPESGTYYISRSGGVNVRSCASISCSVVAQFQFGKTVYVTGFEDGQTISGSSRWAKTDADDYIHSSLLTRGKPPVTATRKPEVTARTSSTSSTIRASNYCETQRIIDELNLYTASYGRCNIDGAYMRAGVLESSCTLIYHYWTDKDTALERLTERRKFAQYLAYLNDEYNLNLDALALQTWDESCTVNLGWEFFDGDGKLVD